jgi:hypothetical protein
MYGSEHCVPNMHAICHLAECVRLFGPVHTQWTFPWERMNGDFGSIPKNRHQVEVQFARHWSRSHHLYAAPIIWGMPLSEAENSIFQSLFGHVRGLHRGTATANLASYALRCSDTVVTGSEPISAKIMSVVEKKDLLARGERLEIQACLQALYSNNKEVDVQAGYTMGHRLQLYTDQLGSHQTRFYRSSFVLCNVNGRWRPAQCLRFVQVQATLSDGKSQEDQKFLLAEVRWYDRQEEETEDYKAGPLGDTIGRWWEWKARSQMAKSLPKYIPVHRIICRFVRAPCFETDEKKQQGGTMSMFRICPLPLQLPL